MPSTYTTNLGIEKIATGEQSGTWGTTTNTNLDLLDEAINGGTSVTLTAPGTTGSPNEIDITNGAASDGRSAFIEVTDGGTALSTEAYLRLTPNDAEKICYVKNSLTDAVGDPGTLVLFQGNYDVANRYAMASGQTAIVRFDGGGTNATVTNLTDNIEIGTLSLNGTDITATGSEINKLDGVTATTAELNYVDTIAGQGAPSKAVILDSNGDFEMQDGDKLKWGNDHDHEIYYDSATDDLTFISRNNGGGFYFDSTGSGGYPFVISAPNSAGSPAFQIDSNSTGGTIPVNYNAGGSSSVNFQLRGSTYSSFTTTGVTHTTSHFYGDNDLINLGAGNDLKLSHNGTNSIIKSETGDLEIIANGNESIVFKSDSPSITGAEVEIDTDRGEVNLSDTATISIGTTSDNNSFNIVGPGLSSYDIGGIFSQSSNDQIYHVSNNIYFYKNGPVGGEAMAQFYGDAGCLLYYNGGLKLSTETDGIRINDSTLTFEGDSANNFETKLVAEDPSNDRTITIPNQTGTLPVTQVTNFSASAGSTTSVSTNWTFTDTTSNQKQQTVRYVIKDITFSSGPTTPTLTVGTYSGTASFVGNWYYIYNTSVYAQNGTFSGTNLLAGASANHGMHEIILDFTRTSAGYAIRMTANSAGGMLELFAETNSLNIASITFSSGNSYNVLVYNGSLTEVILT